ncbi:MAG: VWA domain-containing protein [Devosia nanyangense]|uniref:VWA domain-containing protein n=1 Tax=Devosia nanyangense TaxID=1228055 RepID=A0A933L614_9HYPH|nr:VWA domain-containing protein [Devosia nanyangense]
MKDDQMTDEALFQLKTLRAPQPSPEAKKLALNAAMLAFDAEQAKRPAAKAGWLSRWKIGAGLGVPLGTAVAALVLLPLGTQMYTATSQRADGLPPKGDVTIASSDDKPADVSIAKEKTGPTAPVVSTLATAEPAKPVGEAKDEETGLAGTVTTTEEAPVEMDQLTAIAPAPEQAMGRDALTKMAAPPSANATASGGMASLNAIPLQPEGDNFLKFDENRVKITKEEPVSTFSIDVDTASYSYVRGLLEDGYLPEPEAVRLEEMINYFPYDYPAPASIDTPFQATMTVIPTPWNPKTELLEIGIKGYVPPATERQPENLTFLIDTSGSMDEDNKLPLLKRSFGLLVDSLQPEDTVSIVTYAGSAGLVLRPTKAKDRSSIIDALERLYAGGPTDGADGLALAYRVAEGAKTPGSVNRVILATDGDFNVGIDDPDALKTYIKTQRDQGVFLSVLGFGRGNLDDELMQSLAQNGNGNASYIDNFREAQKVLVEEGGANLVTIAKDVKIQVEFNPGVVSEYRLIGYETRALNREDFNNDAVDAGEIGAGHTVTALYEITPVGSGAELNDPLRYSTDAANEVSADDEIGFLKMRYKAPDGDTSKLIETPIGRDLMLNDIAEAGTDQRFAAAVAAFGQKLKGSNYGGSMSWQQIADLANGAKGDDANGYRAEFVQMIKLAALLNPDHSAGGKSGADDLNGGKAASASAN